VCKIGCRLRKNGSMLREMVRAVISIPGVRTGKRVPLISRM
jgi:hypothetical protein